MKTLYICGDSFSCQDPDYQYSWPDLISMKIGEKIKVVNLARPAASNYLIYLQVKHALANSADYIIYNATSSIRQEFSLQENKLERDHLSRYWNVLTPDDKNVICTSWVSPFQIAPNGVEGKLRTIYSFGEEFLDLPSTIEKNYIFITHTLYLLKSSAALYAWSPGGFEHSSFGTVTDWDFSIWDQFKCNVNLWDYYDRNITRPYFHITDKKILNDVCNQYINMLKLHNV